VSPFLVVLTIAIGGVPAITLIFCKTQANAMVPDQRSHVRVADDRPGALRSASHNAVSGQSGAGQHGLLHR
jgi:hypothetical protein